MRGKANSMHGPTTLYTQLILYRWNHPDLDSFRDTGDQLH
jgi:hypothetical protein